MQRLPPVCLVIWFGISCLHAGPTETAIMAIMRLSDQPNYTWVATVSDDARTYDIIGKTVRGGFTHVKMPVINSVRRQLGRSVTDTQIDLIFRGNVDCVIETEDGWRKPAELPLLSLDEAVAVQSPRVIRHAPRLGISPPIGNPIRSPVLRSSSVPSQRGRSDRAYSNLQLGISHPHEELAVIVGSHSDFKVEGDIVTGALTDLGAQLLLVRDGQENIVPLRAEGSFRLWLRDGTVFKYQVKLEGILDVHLPTGHRQIEVHQVTDTIVKDVGTTEFEVPLQARAKLRA